MYLPILLIWPSYGFNFLNNLVGVCSFWSTLYLATPPLSCRCVSCPAYNWIRHYLINNILHYTYNTSLGNFVPPTLLILIALSFVLLLSPVKKFYASLNLVFLWTTVKALSGLDRDPGVNPDPVTELASFENSETYPGKWSNWIRSETQLVIVRGGYRENF